MWINPFLGYEEGGWGIKTSIIPAGKVCPHIKTMEMMMILILILFKTIKVMSGAQNKVRIITSKEISYHLNLKNEER